ncbi:MAG: hypothetical protein CMO80_24140 [Verrucomicrobiales bacterium]|nr:hypothetical protein [Verrucomicrobiales bacterium]|tara:strand:- start:6801 stop:7136 length:336 start_codon:yes stop_codon:yes gene_type:complete
MALTIGLHWVVLQSLAWAGMVASYSQESSITIALKRTFSGLEPCSICDLVEQGRDSESEPDSMLKTHKLTLINQFASTPSLVSATLETGIADNQPTLVRLNYPPHAPPPLA